MSLAYNPLPLYNETVFMLPEYLNRRIITNHEIKKNLLQIHPNAIDLVNKSERRSVFYENTCFDYLQRQAQDSWVIGPHLVDCMFGKNPALAGLVRPDALLLTLRKDKVTLTGMAEFKSGNGNGFTNKLNGFTVLLRKLKKEPRLLPEMIFYTVGQHIDDTPTNIFIPPDEEIEITFLTPFKNGVLYDASAASFPVTYFRIPLEEQPAA